MNSLITSRKLFLFFIFLCSSISANADFIGSIKAIQGDVLIVKGETKHDVKLHDKVYEGDIVEALPMYAVWM